MWLWMDTNVLPCAILVYADSCLWDLVVGLCMLATKLYGSRWKLGHLYAVSSEAVIIYDLLSCSTLVMIAGCHNLLGVFCTSHASNSEYIVVYHLLIFGCRTYDISLWLACLCFPTFIIAAWNIGKSDLLFHEWLQVGSKWCASKQHHDRYHLSLSAWPSKASSVALHILLCRPIVLLVMRGAGYVMRPC